MEIQLKYFGSISEITKVNSETLNLNIEKLSITELKKMLISKYPIGEISFSIAVNNKIGNPLDFINSKDELAILPPFAGG